jgi:hypothetical protein
MKRSKALRLLLIDFFDSIANLLGFVASCRLQLASIRRQKHTIGRDRNHPEFLPRSWGTARSAKPETERARLTALIFIRILIIINKDVRMCGHRHHVQGSFKDANAKVKG